VGGTLELFHLGVALIALAVIGWIHPLIREQPRAGAETPVATIATRTSDLLSAIPSATKAKRLTAMTAIPAVIKAKRLTVDVERGPAEGQRVTFRRGDKVTILKREDRRFLVRDRRGNQVYVASEKVLPKKSARPKKRQ
jgi:hypothetical protein